MKTENIRIFKVVFSDGTEKFVSDGRNDKKIHASIQSMAEDLREYVEFAFNHKDAIRVLVNMHPLHDIECRFGIAPMRCLPLTENEKQEFWEHFIAP